MSQFQYSEKIGVRLVGITTPISIPTAAVVPKFLDKDKRIVSPLFT